MNRPSGRVPEVVPGFRVSEVSHPPGLSMRCLMRPTMQPVHASAAALIPLLMSLHVACSAPPTTNGSVCFSAASGQTQCDRAVSWQVRSNLYQREANHTRTLPITVLPPSLTFPTLRPL